VSLVFDSSALLALLKGEPGSDFVRELLEDADVPKLAHAVNLCEVFYDFLARGAAETASAETASEAISDLFSLGIEERGDSDGPFWRDVATVIATQRRSGHRLALGDAWGVALARRLDADFVTADRGELEAVAAAGLCRVTFIR
jgi:PIN domain nuclease of toxin-antitoxin system